MADLRATEMWYGRAADPVDYADSAAAPVRYTRYANHGPTTPSPYDIPPLPAYEPIAAYPEPRYFLPPYDYVPEREAPPPPPRHAVPAYDAPQVRPVRAAPRSPHDEIPPFEPPGDMVIPGVQHPDGRFEPHPAFARKPAPRPVHPEEHEGPAHPPQHEEQSHPSEEHGGPVHPHGEEASSKHVVEVAVPVCCEACEERVTNYLGETPGVDKVDCDVREQKVTVVGDLAPEAVLQRCKKCFRKSALSS